MTPWEALGGDEGLRVLLDDLYSRLFVDPMVGFLFEGKDKNHLVEQQVRFMGRALGGPDRYVGKSMPEAHGALPLLAGHFDRRHTLLRRVLQDHRVPAAIAEEWLRLDQALRTSILKAGDEARSLARQEK